MPSAQRARGVIQNNTDFDLVLTDCRLSWGTWEVMPYPRIPKRANQQFAFTAVGTLFAGTEGWAKYRADGYKSAYGDAVLTLCFDDPLRGSNDTDGTTSSDPHFTVSGQVPSSGSNVTFTYTIGVAGLR